MKIIEVNASKKYQIAISENLNGLTNFLLPLIKGDKVAVISDSNVAPLYSSAVINAISNKEVSLLTVNAGEDSKSPSEYIKLIEKLIDLGFSRNSTIIALGGGVVGDLAGLVSATFMRGINLIQIPTSLLAMVDSSIGGKVAININSSKNMLGAFYQPSGVYVCLDFLKTLPRREIVSGFGEIVKYAFISDKITPSDVAQKNYANLIEKSLLVKRYIVENDERESNMRMLLNFGHTIGHAIEKLSGFTLSHGECVIKGIYSALNLSKNLNYLSANDYDLAIKLLKSTGVEPCTQFSKEQILNSVVTDKKGDGESVNFVVTKGFSKAEIIKIKYTELIELI